MIVALDICIIEVDKINALESPGGGVLWLLVCVRGDAGIRFFQGKVLVCEEVVDEGLSILPCHLFRSVWPNFSHLELSLFEVFAVISRERL